MVFAKIAHGGRKLLIFGEASPHVETKIAKAKSLEPLGGTILMNLCYYVQNNVKFVCYIL